MTLINHPRAVFIVLLRAINVTGHNKIPMTELRQLCSDLGWFDVQSYIQSGNLVFKGNAKPEHMESDLEAAIQERFGLTIPVIIRSANAWKVYMKGNPFPDAVEDAPNRVLLTLSKKPPEVGAGEGLRERTDKGERIAQVGDALYIHYPQGVGRSKLTPDLLDRLVGSPVTARNWRTVLKLAEMTTG